MDIDKLILAYAYGELQNGFGSLMDIDKLILWAARTSPLRRFSSLMDIDKLIQCGTAVFCGDVLVL